MKRNVFIAVALFATLTANAQNIAAVSPSNETTMYQTLDEAVTKADNGSIIYLPGGGFQIKDETKITKKLTIMGVSHRGDTDNAEGATAIAGNIFFESGSSGSSVIGVYVSGNINIGFDEQSVNNITVKFCNINGVQVNSNLCSGVTINQNYIRSLSRLNNCNNAIITNNITSAIIGVNGGTVLNNVFVHAERVGDYYSPILEANNSNISYNVFLGTGGSSNGRSWSQAQVHGENNQGVSNMTRGIDWGESCINIGDIEWVNVFEKDAGISIMSQYHFIGDYTEYEGKIGIYGGSGFSDEKSLAPIPRIISKKVDEQTDGSGRLHIQVTIKAQ